MDARKKQILHAVIQDYVDTAEPVGSRTIAKKYDLGISPATIRNEMSDLEEQGYIKQPHTSAGRIPSDKGYRYYVDCLMEPKEQKITKEEKKTIQEAFTKQAAEIDSLLQESCRLLSQLTNYTAMIMKPRQLPGILENVNLVRVDSEHVVVVFTSSGGKLNHRLLKISPDMTPEQILDLEEVLRKRLIGASLSKVTDQMMRELAIQLLQQQNLIRQSMQLLHDLLFGSGEAGKILVNGALNLLSQPEFQDIDKVKELLSALEVDDVVRQLLLPSNHEMPVGTSVFIGDELTMPGMHDCSIVTTPYYVNGEMAGNIGVLGPTRMQYPKVIAMVEQISDELTKKMSSEEQNQNAHKKNPPAIET